MTVTALVVEDENRAYRVVERTLISLGHEHHRVTNQEDAREHVNTNAYAYVLLDLRIPATPRHSFPGIDHGFNLLNDIQATKGPGRLPVIVMTGQSADALNIARELLASGATEIISKPFPTVGRTLSVVIRDVLMRTGVIAPPERTLDTSVPELDAERQRVRVNGKWYDVTDNQKCLLSVLFAAKGAWVQGRQLSKRADKTIKAMPDPVQQIIESRKGTGYGYRLRALLSE